MSRPVRPVALVILTACMAYPQTGPWMMLAAQLHIAPIVVLGLKALLGLCWVLGVLGLWAGDGRAYPLALLAAAGTLLYPGGGMVMAALALVCLIFFRERPEEVPA